MVLTCIDLMENMVNLSKSLLQLFVLVQHLVSIVRKASLLLIVWYCLTSNDILILVCVDTASRSYASLGGVTATASRTSVMVLTKYLWNMFAGHGAGCGCALHLGIKVVIFMPFMLGHLLWVSCWVWEMVNTHVSILSIERIVLF